MNPDDQRIAFCGTGQMAKALAAGFCREVLKPGQVCGFDPNDHARQQFRETVGADACGQLADAVRGATVVVLAVKPQVMPTLVSSLKPLLAPSQLVVSIAAGVTLESLSEGLSQQLRMIRIMPNTPCLIGRGACGLCAGHAATAKDVEFVTVLMQTVGIVQRLPENLMDAVTGLSGSGPAYVYRIIQALSDGGVKMGLPREAATRLAAQTVAGAAEMVLQSNAHPGVLTDAVTSPGGTTIAGLHALERGGLNAALMEAVEAATLRSAELGG